MTQKLKQSLLIVESVVLGLLLLVGPPAQAQGDDTIFSAMNDELARCKTRLKIQGHDSPYYVSYAIEEEQYLGGGASFGALRHRNEYKTRSIKADVRVGSYELDNSGVMSNAFSIGSGKGFFGGNQIPIEDDYYAIRRNIWLCTDQAYKKAIEDLESKKAILKNQVIQDRPPDFSRETPIVHVEPVSKPVPAEERSLWVENARKLSAIFKKFPHIKSSSVDFHCNVSNRWFLNNEGFKSRKGTTDVHLSIEAVAQADDGMAIGDATFIVAPPGGALPPYEKCAAQLEQFATRLSNWASAPLADKYEGPVLFEKEAAAQFIQSSIGERLKVDKKELSETPQFEEARQGMESRINKKVLPRFLSVIDDPTVREYKGEKLFGWYNVDDQGVPAQRVVLVEKGILKTLCSGRSPLAQIKKSNGHYIGSNCATSILLVESDNQVDAAELRKRLIEEGKEEGLKFVYIIRRLASPAGQAQTDLFYSSFSSSDDERYRLPSPVETYQIDVATGKETPVRVGAIIPLYYKDLRQIDATGNDTAPHIISDFMRHTAHVISPSLLVKEIEIEKGDSRVEKPPVLKHPYFESISVSSSKRKQSRP